MKIRPTITLIIVFMLILFVWQFGEYLLNINRANLGLTSLEAFIPTPITIFKTIQQNYALILTELGYTYFRGLLGLILGTAISLLIIVLICFLPKLREIIMPITVSLNSFPMVGFAPLIILLFGQGSVLGIIFISALISYFPTFVILDKAVNEVNEEYIGLAKIWGANKLSLFIRIQLPYILPFIFTSLKLSLPASIIGAILGEWLGTKHGIGQLITVSLYQLRPGLLYSSLIMVVISVGLFIKVISILENYIVPWKRK